MDRALSLLRAEKRLLRYLIEGIDTLGPTLVCFVPARCFAVGVREWFARLRTPREWLHERVRLFFVDPLHLTIARTNGGRGFELLFPREWVARAMPLFRLGLSLLRAAVVVGRLTGFPVPNLQAVAGDWLDQQLAVADSLREDAISFLAESTCDTAQARTLLEAVERCAADRARAFTDGVMPARGGMPLRDALEKPLKKSVAALDKLLSASHPTWKSSTGLTRVIAEDGTIDWVLPEDGTLFRARGAALYEVEERTGPVATGCLRPSPHLAGEEAQLKVRVTRALHAMGTAAREREHTSVALDRLLTSLVGSRRGAIELPFHEKVCLVERELGL